MLPLPHKFNAAQRHKFTKKQYRVTNWPDYNEGLRQRGDLTLWGTDNALEHWTAPRRKSLGRQRQYSDLAITICLTLGVVYKQPLRQTQGLMRGIAKLMGLEIAVPDFSTLSRRRRRLNQPVNLRTRRAEPVHLVVDSTGLKIFGEGEWLHNKYKTEAKRKKWRKLHLGLDLLSGDRFCRNFCKWLQNWLSLDTIMQRVMRIAEKRIGHWL